MFLTETAEICEHGRKHAVAIGQGAQGVQLGEAGERRQAAAARTQGIAERQKPSFDGLHRRKVRGPG